MLVPSGAQPTSRHQSATIQHATDQFIALIQGEKAKEREASERRLAALESEYGQYRQQTSAKIALANARAAAAEEQLRVSLAAKQQSAAAVVSDTGALERAQDEARLLSEAVAWKDKKIDELQQALAERDQHIANLNERLLELEQRSSGSGTQTGAQASGVPPGGHGKDEDTMMAFLNMDACDPVVSAPLSCPCRAAMTARPASTARPRRQRRDPERRAGGGVAHVRGVGALECGGAGVKRKGRTSSFVTHRVVVRPPR